MWQLSNSHGKVYYVINLALKSSYFLFSFHLHWHCIRAFINVLASGEYNSKIYGKGFLKCQYLYLQRTG